MHTLLVFERASLGYVAGFGQCRASAVVLHDVSLRVERGDVLGIVGPAGVGKTTLLLSAAALLQPLSGSVHRFVDEPPRYVRVPHLESLSRQRTGGGPDVVALDDLPTRVPLRMVRLVNQRRREGDAFLIASRDRASLAAFGARIITLSFAQGSVSRGDVILPPPSRVAEPVVRRFR